jgi:hypothetical protein
MAPLAIERVLATIEFDREANARTIEVQHVWPDRMLSPEIQSVQLIAPEALPELAFDIGQIAPQAPRALRHLGPVREARR